MIKKTINLSNRKSFYYLFLNSFESQFLPNQFSHSHSTDNLALSYRFRHGPVKVIVVIMADKFIL